MKILLMGPQGAGKGTVGEALSLKLNIPLIGVGKILRSLSQNHPRYEEINSLMSQGKLVPKNFVAELLKERIAKHDCANGYIFDGWARSMVDLQHFDPDYDRVVVINIPRQESVRRITGRRICSADGKIYNIYTLPSNELKKCKGSLIQRVDDTEEAVNNRLAIYYSETIEVINYYKSKGIVVEVDGVGPPEEVSQRVYTALGIAT